MVRTVLIILLAVASALAGWSRWSVRTHRWPVAQPTPRSLAEAKGEPRAAMNPPVAFGRPFATSAASASTDAGVAALRGLEADIRAAAELPDPDERWTVLAKACLRWADYDPHGALKLAHELQLEDANRVILADIVQRWAEQNIAAAIAWVTGRPADAERDEMLARVAVTWSQSQPTAAARLVVEQMSPGAVQDEAGIAIVHQWAQHDYAAAEAWVARFPAGDLRVRALAELAVVAQHPSS